MDKGQAAYGRPKAEAAGALMEKMYMAKIRLLNEISDRGIRWADLPSGLFEILVEQQTENDNLLYFEGQMDLLTTLVMTKVLK